MAVDGPIDQALSAQCQSLQEQFQEHGLNNERARALWDHFSNFYRYSDYLGLLIEDWRTLSVECGDRYQRFFAVPHGSLTDDESKEFTEILQLFHRLSLVTESFLIFAKIFLDRLADAFLWFLREAENRWGSSHTYLFGNQNNFLRICTKRSLASIGSITEQGPRLLSRVVEARNKFIEHTAGKSTWGGPLVQHNRAFAIHDVREDSIMTSPVYDHDQLLLEIRDYTAKLFTFLGTNMKTIAELGDEA